MPYHHPDKVLPSLTPEIYRSDEFIERKISSIEYSDLENISLIIAHLVMSALYSPSPEDAEWELLSDSKKYTQKAGIESLIGPAAFSFEINYEDYEDNGGSVVFEVTIHHPNGTVSKIWTTLVFEILPSLEDGLPQKFIKDITVGIASGGSRDTLIYGWGSDIDSSTQSKITNTIDQIHAYIWNSDFEADEE